MTQKYEITDDEVWYIIVNNETRGPLSLRDLDVLIRTNGINSQTYAWKNGLKDWKILNQIEEIKESILESSKQIIEIQKKRQHLFDKNGNEPALNKTQNATDNKATTEQELNNQLIENKDENPLQILELTVENLIKKSFHQTEDCKWNLYDEQRGQWVKQDDEPVQKMIKMKNELFSKLKNELFSQHKDHNKKSNNPKQEEKKIVQEIPLTQEQLLKRERNKKKTKRQAEKKKEKWYSAKINTFIYISGLPFDITDEELKQFVTKAGVLRIDLTTGKQKLKIYKDQNGLPKGDAAVSYAKQESVEIALENLNQNQIRSGFPIKIQRALFNQKQDDYKPRELKKQAMAKKIQAKMKEQKQLAWDEDIDEKGEGLKIVIMKYIFDPARINEEEYVEDVKKEMSEEVEKIGQIQRIRFYETHPDGVVEVKYKKEKDAEECVHLMNGRYYDRRQIICEYWDGETDFKRNANSILLEKERLEQFAEEIQKPHPKRNDLSEEDAEFLNIDQNQENCHSQIGTPSKQNSTQVKNQEDQTQQ